MSQGTLDMQPTYDPVDDWDAGVRAYFEAAFGRDHFARMAPALLRPPLGACLRVNPLCTTPQVHDTFPRLHFRLRHRPVNTYPRSCTGHGVSGQRCQRSPCCHPVQSVIERLPEALGLDAAAMSESGADAQPYALPDVPGVVIIPGSGPHAIDYSATGWSAPRPARGFH